ncbi:MAG: hypothetical protein U0K54_04065 [Acutalibacteraceae bacterium]|nr:hypothetical protein [Acutalibacteraceae bacterium]
MEEKNKVAEFFCSSAGKAVIIVVGYILIMGVILVAVQSEQTAIAGIALLVCAIFGWKALNKITPDIFLFMSITGWIIYFGVKGFLSIFIGVFVAPFQIAKMISNTIANSVN